MIGEAGRLAHHPAGGSVALVREAELRRRGVQNFRMACLYTGDDTKLGLPNWDTLEAYQPVTGWVAVSQTMLQNYGWLVAQQPVTMPSTTVRGVYISSIPPMPTAFSPAFTAPVLPSSAIQPPG